MPAFFLSIPGVVAVTGLVVLVAHGFVTGRATPARLTAPRSTTPRLKMQIVISLVVLATALYVVVARPEATDDHKWAYSIVGTVVGYWLRGR